MGHNILIGTAKFVLSLRSPETFVFFLNLLFSVLKLPVEKRILELKVKKGHSLLPQNDRNVCSSQAGHGPIAHLSEQDQSVRFVHCPGGQRNRGSEGEVEESNEQTENRQSPDSIAVEAG